MSTAEMSSFLIFIFFASSGAAISVTSNMVGEVNRRRAGEGKPLRKWSWGWLGVVSDYRAACPRGKLTRILIIVISLVLLSGAELVAEILLRHSSK